MNRFIIKTTIPRLSYSSVSSASSAAFIQSINNYKNCKSPKSIANIYSKNNIVNNNISTYLYSNISNNGYVKSSFLSSVLFGEDEKKNKLEKDLSLLKTTYTMSDKGEDKALSGIALETANKILEEYPTHIQALTYKSLLLLFNFKNPQQALEVIKSATEAFESQKSTMPPEVVHHFNLDLIYTMSMCYAELDQLKSAAEVIYRYLLERDELLLNQKNQLPQLSSVQLNTMQHLLIVSLVEEYKPKAFEILLQIDRDYPNELNAAQYFQIGMNEFERKDQNSALHFLNKGFNLLDFDELLNKYREYPHLFDYVKSVNNPENNDIKRESYKFNLVAAALRLRGSLLELNNPEKNIEERIKSFQLNLELNSHFSQLVMPIHFKLSQLQSNSQIQNYKDSLKHVKTALKLIEENKYDKLENKCELMANGAYCISVLRPSRKESDPFIDECIQSVIKIVNNNKTSPSQNGKVEFYCQTFLLLVIRYYIAILENPDEKEWNDFIMRIPDSNRQIINQRLSLYSKLDDISQFIKRWQMILEWAPSSSTSPYFEHLRKLFKTLEIAMTLPIDSNGKETQYYFQNTGTQYSFELVKVLNNTGFNGGFRKIKLNNINYIFHELNQIKWNKYKAPCNANQLVQDLTEYIFISGDDSDEQAVEQAQLLMKKDKSIGYVILAYVLVRFANRQSPIFDMVDQSLIDADELNTFESELERQLFVTVRGYIEYHHKDQKKGIATLCSLIKDNPHCHFAKMVLARCYIGSYQFQEAETLLRELMLSSDNKTKVSSLIVLSQLKYQQEEYAIALKMFESVYIKNLMQYDSKELNNYFIRKGILECQYQMVIKDIIQWKSELNAKQLEDIEPILDLISGIANIIVLKDRIALKQLKKLDHFKSVDEILMKLPNFDKNDINALWYYYAILLPKLSQGNSIMTLESNHLLIFIYKNMKDISHFINDEAKVKYYNDQLMNFK